MLSEQEQLQIRLLSDNELYPQAVDFMKGIGKALPPTQVNGLLNVSLGDNSYADLKRFIEGQHGRTTWPNRDLHIPEFYRRLIPKLKQIETYVPAITVARAEKPSPQDEQAVKMALAREFIQHILAENAYRGMLLDVQAKQKANDPRDSRQQYGRGVQKQ